MINSYANDISSNYIIEKVYKFHKFRQGGSHEVARPHAWLRSSRLQVSTLT